MAEIDIHISARRKKDWFSLMDKNAVREHWQVINVYTFVINSVLGENELNSFFLSISTVLDNKVKRVHFGRSEANIRGHDGFYKKICWNVDKEIIPFTHDSISGDLEGTDLSFLKNIKDNKKPNCEEVHANWYKRLISVSGKVMVMSWIKANHRGFKT